MCVVLVCFIKEGYRDVGHGCGTRSIFSDVILTLICQKPLLLFFFRFIGWVYAKWWPNNVLASVVQQNIECLMIIRGTNVVVENHTLCKLYDIKDCSRTLCGPNHPLFFTHPSRGHTHTHTHIGVVTRAFKITLIHITLITLTLPCSCLT